VSDADPLPGLSEDTMKIWRFAATMVTLLLAAPACAQPSPVKVGHVQIPVIAASPEDVASLDAMIRTMYEVLCGPAGQPRQWSRDRTLYVPGVRFFILSEDKNHRTVERTVSHQEFVDLYDRELTAGFYEREIHRTTLQFGNAAHVFSTYETRTIETGPVTGRGINSVGLFHDGTRWWISSITWDEERPDNPLPPDYLPPANANANANAPTKLQEHHANQQAR
jgi:hypothetical protein